MDAKEKKIKDGLLRIARQHGPVLLYDGIITAVDAENYFVDVQLDTEGVIYECRLRAASIGNKSIDVLPAIGAAVVLAKIADDDYMVLACDEVDDIRFTAQGFEIQLNDEGISVTNGTETLNKILTDLVTGVLSVAAPKDVPGLTELLTRINTLLK